MEVIFLHRSRGWKDFQYVCICMCMYKCVCMCVYVYVCIYSAGCNFYPIATKFGTQVILVEFQVYPMS